MTAPTATLERESSDLGRAAALAAPAVLPLAMTAVFKVAADRWGPHAGYLAGFGVYWASCAVLSIGILGRKRIAALFGAARPPLGIPAAAGAAVLLLWPMAGAVATRFVPELGGASAAMVATALSVAVVNAACEELLWRGVYISLWPSNPWLGWLWPAVGFGAWHLAPQVVHPSALGPVAYVVAAMALGLSWGWVAWRTKSLRWVAASHVLTDGSGIRNALFFLGG
jgi:uncharacterized protein